MNNSSSDVLAIELGPEWDDVLLSKLHIAVKRAGGTMKELSWGVGGSQEVTTYRIQLPGGSIEVTAETYMGLIIRGPSALVQQIAAAVKAPTS
jgi:hypothetical protein